MATKLEKMEFLAETLHRCLNREPKLDLEDIAIVLSEQIEDITELLKKYKKHIKKLKTLNINDTQKNKTYFNWRGAMG